MFSTTVPFWLKSHFGSAEPFSSFLLQTMGEKGRDNPWGDKRFPHGSDRKRTLEDADRLSIRSRGSSFSGSKWQKNAIPPKRADEDAGRSKQKADTIALGRSSGVMAAGAWSARLEVANLLESRCDPQRLVMLIRSGKEGSHDLMPDGSVKSGEEAPVSPTGSIPYSPTSPGSEFKEGKVEEDLMKQKAILESLSEAPGNVPPWQNPRKRDPSTTPAHPSSGPSVVALEAGFTKRANPPPKGLRGIQVKEEEEPEVVPPIPVEETEAIFGKKATPPSDEQRASVGRPALGGLGGSHHGSDRPVSQGARELLGLEAFHRATVGIFKMLRIKGINMDLVDIIEGPDGELDLDRFRVHTSPNRASTGNRYARLIQGFLKWESGVYNPFASREEPFEKLNCLLYMELLAQKEVGARTLQAFLYAIDYYAKALGFQIGGGHFGRAKRLAQRYSQLRRTDRKGAPMFTRDTMIALEKITCDPLIQVAQRVAAGKLRLCIQASIRHNDLVNTPLSSCEWVRRRGDIHIVGLKGKANRGKTNARAWVASILSVDKDSAEWLPTLMQLLLDAHGAGWKADDHCGKSPTAKGDAFTFVPATLETDVMTVKVCLSSMLRRGVPIGLEQDQVDTLRWHGAKATLTSVMQHLNISPKVVRFSGDWHDANESMADVYLREAMVMVLRGQERALAYLRAGGDLGGLVGEPLVKPPTPEGSSEVNLAECEPAMVPSQRAIPGSC